MAKYGPHQPAGSFALDIQQFVDKAKGNADQVVRRIAWNIFGKVIAKSPVGLPELWAANKAVKDQRVAYTAAREALGKSASKRTLDKKFPLLVGQGYVGGRFKSNWQVAIGSIPTGTIETNDKGASALAKVSETTLSMRAGQIIYLINNLSYARPLEYGYSSQAPNGMVRLTVQEFPGVVRAAVSEVQK